MENGALAKLKMDPVEKDQSSPKEGGEGKIDASEKSLKAGHL